MEKIFDTRPSTSRGRRSPGRGRASRGRVRPWVGQALATSVTAAAASGGMDGLALGEEKRVHRRTGMIRNRRNYSSRAGRLRLPARDCHASRCDGSYARDRRDGHMIRIPCVASDDRRVVAARRHHRRCPPTPAGGPERPRRDHRPVERAPALRAAAPPPADPWHHAGRRRRRRAGGGARRGSASRSAASISKARSRSTRRCSTPLYSRAGRPRDHRSSTSRRLTTGSSASIATTTTSRRRWCRSRTSPSGRVRDHRLRILHPRRRASKAMSRAYGTSASGSSLISTRWSRCARCASRSSSATRS